MRGRLWLAGAAIAAIMGSTASVASVVVVKSLGPSSKAYPPGKTLPESAKITLQGGSLTWGGGPNSNGSLINTSTIQGYSAATGWDPASGLGSPKANTLVPALALSR